MRRLLLILLVLATGLGGAPALVAPAGAQVLPDDPRAGLVYDGLRQAAGGLCGGAYEALIDAWATPAMKQVLCTHGPDPAPEGIDVRADRAPDPFAATAAETGSVPCYGNGTDGYRVQLLYARSSSRTDRYATYEASFRSWAARMDQVVRDSAAETGGVRHVRFVTDAACNPVIERVVLSTTAMSSFSSMVSELHSRGFARTDRKYLVWADTNTYCGISEIYTDDTADPTPGRNYNNGHPWVQGAVGRVDNGCWGLTNLVEAHELLHLLGGVQPSAPNATPGFHCRDESDRLCYDDGTGGSVRQVCPTWHETLYDCNHDDYFSTAPAPGSWLSAHWNTASSAFLTSQAPAGPVTTTTLPPPPTTTTSTTTTTVPPPTTTTTRPPTTTTAPPATTTTLGPPATTTTTAPPPPPPATGVPSAPGLRASQPTVGVGVQLSWSAPATGPVTGYRVYRGTSPYVQTFLAQVGNVLGFTDATAGRALYYYRVTAYNAAGEGPSSNLAGMIGTAPTPAGTVREDIDRRLVVSDLRSWAPWAFRWA